MSPRRTTSKATPRNEEREQHIANEVIVDAYGPEEQAMGWYYYLQDRIAFPFTAVRNAARQISPLRVGGEVEAMGMAQEDECEREMFVLIRWGHRTADALAVPLSQLDLGADNVRHVLLEQFRGPQPPLLPKRPLPGARRHRSTHTDPVTRIPTTQPINNRH